MAKKRRQSRIPGASKIPVGGPAAHYVEGDNVPLAPDEHASDLHVSNVALHPDADPNASDLKAVMFIDTPTMKNLMHIARRDGFRWLCPEEIEAKMEADGKHMVRRPMLVNGDEYLAVRAIVWLKLVGHPGGYAIILDFPSKQMGTLIEVGLLQKSRNARDQEWKRRLTPKPVWAGSHSFDRAWDHLSRVAAIIDQTETGGYVPSRSVISDSVLWAMHRAHVVCMSPEQAAVLPEWEAPEHLWDYVQDAVLPFDPTYFDFEGPGGIAVPVEVPVEVEGGKAWMHLRGAAIWQDNPRQDADLVVAPIGWPDDMFARPDQSRVRVPLSEYDCPGLVIFGTRMLEDERRFVPLDLEINGVNTRGLGVPTKLLYPDSLGMHGFVQLPLAYDEAKHSMHEDRVLMWAQIVLTLAARTVAALSILEADEVEMVDAPMEKRDIKRATKRGWPISKFVHIRSAKRYVNRNEPSGEEAHLSHRFWVRGHTKHFPVGTRMADARPDLCQPCHRCGVCRRVKTPAFIKGPEDKPLVLKTLLRDKEQQDKEQHG